MAKTNPRYSARLRRKKQIRKRITGANDRLRLSVFRSSKHIYAQIVDDETGRTVASASTLSTGFKGHDGNKGNKEAAKVVGKNIAKQAKAAGVERVAFDRNGYLYHGRVKALADAAREAGLTF